ncbi:MAG: NAD+ synthase [Actinomycetota bacterium]|nr:NAD+ synthase [Actinomycetota bacterium]
MPHLRIALAQVNPTVGDLTGNADLVVEWSRRARAEGAHVVAFPELMLAGYPIEDLALRESFAQASQRNAADLARRLADEGLAELVVVVGYLDRAEESAPRLGVPHGSPLNAAAVMTGGDLAARSAKHHLPNYGVFDEARYFVPGDTLQVVQVHQVDVALAICEDIWQDGPSVAARAAEAGLLLVINASPYERAKDDHRFDLVARRAREADAAVAYVNLVGGQDELVFDGDSIVVDAAGGLVARAGQFSEELLVVDLELPAATAPMPDPDARFGGLRVQRTVIGSLPLPPRQSLPVRQEPRLDDLGEVYAAVTLGLRDYVRKNGFASVLMGLSGGIDSTVVATIACDAIGASNVHGVSNPSAWSTEHSRSDAAELARRTGLSLVTVAIAPIVDAFEREVQVDGLAAENLQARVRAVIWMALSNQHGHLVLACGNKSELATGYSTIYGDAVGGYAPIKDVPKTLVWDLARWRNAEAVRRGDTPPIPENTISKPPSAELRADQLDSDSLPEYDLLDAVLDAYVEQDQGTAQLSELGYDATVVERVITLVDRAEFKRRQYPPGPKISVRNFGRDRRLPITNAWREHL